MIALVIDSDESRRKGVVYNLQGAGFNIVEIEESGGGLNRVADSANLIIIMDEETQPVGGLKLVSDLRRLTDAPIIVRGSGGGDSLVQLIYQGADLYLERTVSVREFLARVHAVQRRYATSRGITARNRPQPTDGAGPGLCSAGAPFLS